MQIYAISNFILALHAQVSLENVIFINNMTVLIAPITFDRQMQCDEKNTERFA